MLYFINVRDLGSLAIYLFIVRMRKLRLRRMNWFAQELHREFTVAS